MSQPNVLIFFTDQQRADTCGCYGQALDVTPQLDRMAQEGVVFNHAMSMQPVCGPARASLMTGQYPTRTGCFRNAIGLAPHMKTMAHAMSGAGYETAYIGKWHLSSHRDSGDPERPDVDSRSSPVPPGGRGGFDDFWLASDVLEFTSTGYSGHMFAGDGSKREFPVGGYRADVQTDWVLEYLENRSTQKPFFLVTSYIEPHHQNSSGHYEGPHGSKERWKDFAVPGDLVDTEGDWREEYPDYLGCCEALDQGLGRVRSKLQELGELENTVIIYLADHGSHFKTRNGEYKRSCHDSSLHVPLVISGPGFTGGQRIDPCVSLIDVPRTVLSLGGAKLIPDMDGRDLGEIVGGCDDWPDEVFYQISESEVGRGIRSLQWKYYVHALDLDPYNDSASDVYHEACLYDLKNDPYERNNLVESPAHVELRAELAKRLIRRMVAAGEAAPEIRPKRSLAQ
ncbi:sulfatase-like hydrolase/transferase [Coraliomargarita parva]|uniref:sulfatase-like hydrolase/transferase n=1 Tax=Coraliomargarita parva TaxID=3014050 RepID=UPI0022B539AA|nr:sulfatase-like hydrolase/transferase [Coraliomargarita parva]